MPPIRRIGRFLLDQFCTHENFWLANSGTKEICIDSAKLIVGLEDMYFSNCFQDWGHWCSADRQPPFILHPKAREHWTWRPPRAEVPDRSPCRKVRGQKFQMSTCFKYCQVSDSLPHKKDEYCTKRTTNTLIQAKKKKSCKHHAPKCLSVFPGLWYVNPTISNMS